MRESFHVTDDAGALICVAALKTFAIKAHIDVYRDEARTQLAFTIQQKSALALTKTYEVADAAGQIMGAFRLQAMQSLLAEHWEILNAGGAPLGTIEQDKSSALMGRVAAIVPQSFVAKINDQPVCVYHEEVNIGVSFKMDIDFSGDTGNLFDRTLGIAGAILLASRHLQTK